MAVMAQWRDMTFEISSNKVNPIEDLSFRFAQISNKNKDAEGTPQTNERGTELFPLSFSSKQNASAGIDILAEIAKWKERVTRKGYFYLNGKPFGPIVQLNSFKAGNIITDDFGRLRSAVFSFSFTEYDRETTTVVDNSAVEVEPGPAEKAELKPKDSSVESAPSTGITVGARVKIIGNKYYTGQNIPQFVKDKSHEVSSINGNKVLLGYPDGICSYVYLKDLSLC